MLLCSNISWQPTQYYNVMRRNKSCICCSSSRSPFVGGDAGRLSLRPTVTFVICSVAPCIWRCLSSFLPPLTLLHLSSDNPANLAIAFLVNWNLLASLSQIFSDLWSFIWAMCPTHFIRLLIILPTMQVLVPTSSLRYNILLLSALFTTAILLIQLFSHTCSLRCCCSDRAIASKPYVLADRPTTQEFRLFLFSFLEIFLSFFDPSILYSHGK